MPLFYGPTDRSPLFRPPRRADGTNTPTDAITSASHLGRRRPYIVHHGRRASAPAETGPSTARYMLFLFFTTAVPEWHPYQGSTVQEAITTSQNNQFEGNRYYGDWKFIHFDRATILSFDDWQREAAQDRSSLRVDSGYAPQSATPRRTPASWATYL